MWRRVDGLRAMELGTPGEQRARLTAHVLTGRKRATTGLLAEYEGEGEPLEQVGERLPLVDDDGAPLAVVRVTAVTVCPFAEVTWEFADAEGEGFIDLRDWREVHRAFWKGQGTEVEDSTQVVCVRFDLEA